jgi:hypothetical protein
MLLYVYGSNNLINVFRKNWSNINEKNTTRHSRQIVLPEIEF